VKRSAPGAGDHQHADEPDPDGGPAPRADPLAQQRHAEGADEQGCCEEDRHGHRQGQVFKREEVEEGRPGQEQPAQDLLPWRAGAKQAQPLLRQDQRHGDGEMRREAHEHHLRRRQPGLNQPLGRSVDPGKHQKRQQHQ
jgi:hypothetical protein